MRVWLTIALALSLVACGEEFESKASSKAPNGSANNANPANASNAGNPNSLPDDLMATFGTEGPIDGAPKSNGGNATCDFAAIRTDDLAGNLADDHVPPGAWDATPVGDAPGRCGDDFETGVWRLMNCERIGRSLPPLRCDLRLVWLGRAHSQDMVTRSYFAHDNPDGETPFDRMNSAGVAFRGAGENIALNPSIEGAHFAWMDSPGHRGNMLSESYQYAGTGYHQNYYTTGFVSP